MSQSLKQGHGGQLENGNFNSLFCYLILHMHELNQPNELGSFWLRIDESVILNLKFHNNGFVLSVAE